MDNAQALRHCLQMGGPGTAEAQVWRTSAAAFLPLILPRLHLYLQLCVGICCALELGVPVFVQGWEACKWLLSEQDLGAVRVPYRTHVPPTQFSDAHKYAHTIAHARGHAQSWLLHKPTRSRARARMWTRANTAPAASPLPPPLPPRRAPRRPSS
jgi:hypothetical protein